MFVELYVSTSKYKFEYLLFGGGRGYLNEGLSNSPVFNFSERGYLIGGYLPGSTVERIEGLEISYMLIEISASLILDVCGVLSTRTFLTPRSRNLP